MDSTPDLVVDFPGGSIGGAIKSENGIPLSGTKVRLVPIAGRKHEQAWRFKDVTAGADGSFAFYCLTTGEYAIASHGEGFFGTQVNFPVKSPTRLAPHLYAPPR